MKYSFADFKKIVCLIKENIIDNHVSSITVINSHDILLSFSLYRKARLFISLNHQKPFIAFTNNKESFVTTIGQLNDTLRKALKDAYITGVDILNDDKILKVNFEKSNDYFEKVKKSLIIELIPHKQNLIILNENGIIEFAIHNTSIDVSRPIAKGLLYQLPNKSENYVEDTPMSENQLSSLVAKYIETAKETKLKERYNDLFKFIKSKIKSFNNKIEILNKEIISAKNNLIYQEHANMMLALANDKEELENYFNANSITYDSNFSIGQYANILFKKYKKAKRTIEIDSYEISKTEDQIYSLNLILKQVPYMDDEDLYNLALEMMPHKFKQLPRKNPKTIFSYINIEGVKIYFGKSSKQNEELTFKFARNNYSYFHIKDYHGSHVIVASEQLTNNIILTACELCLLLSDKTTGDIMYTQVKNVKKGDSPGQALMTNYKLITLREIRLTTIDKLKHYQK